MHYLQKKRKIIRSIKFGQRVYVRVFGQICLLTEIIILLLQKNNLDYTRVIAFMTVFIL